MGPQGPSPQPALCPGTSLFPHHLPPPGFPGDQWGGGWAKRPVPVPQPFSPAHDLMSEQHTAHFGVLVLPLVDDGLRKEKCMSLGGRRLLSRPGEGQVGPPPREEYALQLSLGAQECKAGAGNRASQTGTAIRMGKNGVRSTESVRPQAALSGDSSALGHGGPPTTLTKTRHMLQPPRFSQASSLQALPPAPHPGNLCRPGQRLPLGLLKLPLTPQPVPSLSLALKQGVSFLNAHLASNLKRLGLPAIPHLWVSFSVDSLQPLPRLSAIQSHFATSQSASQTIVTTGILETHHFFLFPGIGWRLLEACVCGKAQASTSSSGP